MKLTNDTLLILKNQHALLRVALCHNTTDYERDVINVQLTATAERVDEIERAMIESKRDRSINGP